MNEYLLGKFNQVEKYHWWWEGRRKLVTSLLKDYEVKRVLDIGCGTGETLIYIKKMYPQSKVYGIDSSRKAVGYARSRGLKNIHHADATKLPFPSSSFDTVLLLDVMEHIKDDELVMKELKRVLKKSGVAIITTPAVPWIWSKHDTMQGHVKRYMKRDFKRLAEKSGMELSFISYFNLFLFVPIALIRLVSNLPFLQNYASYDNYINYNIANQNCINNLLTKLFTFEVSLLSFVRFPIGVSIGCRVEK